LVGIGLALTAAAVGFAGLVAVNAMARQTVREAHTYAFTGTSLSIDVALGDVQIVPGTAGEIIVARRLTYGLRRPVLEERIDGDTFRVSDNNCTADVAFPCHVRWLLQVPRSLSVEVRTVSGSITGLVVFLLDVIPYPTVPVSANGRAQLSVSGKSPAPFPK